MLRHPGHLGRDPAARTAHARVVEQDDLPLPGERIDHGGVPVVERPGEVLKEQERKPAASTESPVGVFIVVHRDEFRRRRRAGAVRYVPHIILWKTEGWTVLRPGSIIL